MADLDDDELLEALGVELAPIKAGGRTPREERVIAGFEDILRFYDAHKRVPQHGEGRDIFERLYAVRLDQLRKLAERTAASHSASSGITASASTWTGIPTFPDSCLTAGPSPS